MESDRYVLNLVLVALLIGLSAFFVAVEFAVIRIRASRVDQLIDEGKKGAVAVKKVLGNLDGYLSACQLGITITSLCLGFLGEPTVEKILHPLFEQWGLSEGVRQFLSLFIAFAIITYLHVVIGELAPKTIAIRKAETVALLTATPIIWFNKIMYPFIWILNGSANQLVRLFGIKPASEHEDAHSEEELQIILSESFESGKINRNEFGYVSRIFAFDNMLAKEIMVPRTDMICLYKEKPRAENVAIIKEQQYTRFPLVDGNKDNVIGIINTKQFFLAYEDDPDVDVTKLLHPVMAVSEVTPVNTLLKRMQLEGTHMAILIDEYGGTSGLVTIEDIIEEIVGEIRDEFDGDEEEDIQIMSKHHMIVDGKVSLYVINDHFNLDLDSHEWDTIGGWLYSQQSEMEENESLVFDGVKFTLLERDNNRYCKLDIKKRKVSEE
ncbi:hemolysin family protein [Paenibacillus pini]|uniref:Magnesium and cobalt efflux protein CorC n=1 Tax=Paenibacillus pini JCM 16418 TaxID=1236976 RepID=W7YMB9_9BACL|nr:hemolysin family protein [Paenibacillus pini]GAF09572.1 magnesium and cobalt efflux protein CorC [Paenibacillus pini JCM 16418]